MNWGLEDLAAAGVTLGGAGMLLAAIFRLQGRTKKLLLSALVILLALAIWAELAVGIF